MVIERISRFLGGKGAGDVLRGMLTLAMGASFARVIGIASIPFLTRLYTPDDFGVLSLFTAFLMVTAPVLTLRYVVAVPLPRVDAFAYNLFALNLLLLVIITAVVGTLLWLFHSPLLRLVSAEALVPYWWLIVLGAFAVSGYELMTMWATRRRDYRILARTQVFQSFTGESVKIALGVLGVHPLGLILGQIASQSMGAGTMLGRFRQDGLQGLAAVSWTRMKKAAVLYREYPFFRLPSQFLLVFSAQSPLLFAGFMYGAGFTGQLGLALMALALPVNLVGTSMARAYYAETARLTKKQPGHIYQLTLVIQRNLFLLAIVPALVIYFAGEYLFMVAFGPEWREAGLYASLLSVYLFFQFTSAPLMKVLNVFGLQKVFLCINVFRLACLFLLYGLLFSNDAAAATFVGLYSWLMAGFYLLISVYVVFFLRKLAEKGAAL
ncbi:Membrane protein involved in the export of O-antigen and teichoic acid [Marinobacter segnicrescens]|uniref:Membrane protein involved in the export of O-antigen and teichoic acid n=1 Tax=Marinobacter segnicrescens TaxID=430453 RepID=A0A1I0HWF1_9GAMM|nr:Membrane protein involved in the export of O-antigen and teichoic acid [Marinobacter segnicrescens]